MIKYVDQSITPNKCACLLGSVMGNFATILAFTVIICIMIRHDVKFFGL